MNDYERVSADLTRLGFDPPVVGDRPTDVFLRLARIVVKLAERVRDLEEEMGANP